MLKNRHSIYIQLNSYALFNMYIYRERESSISKIKLTLIEIPIKASTYNICKAHTWNT